MNNINLNELRNRAYKTACEHGFHDKELSNEHCLCLIVGALMKAVEADRKGRHANVKRYKDMTENSLICKGYNTMIPKEKGFIVAYEDTIKGSVEEELSDACIILMDMAGLIDINLSSISFPISNSAEHINSRKALTFTEWCYDVTRVIARYDKNNYPIGYLFVGILQEMCCIAEIIGFDLLWHIEQKMRYNELRPKLNGKIC
ncbi:hypothetical protein PL684_05135 [Phocaeicola vulgatus]|jgi:hypothetical protein|uniref:hypothetical protein n=1 Tax=Phocaeicola vulgatus TaxID=821 RepID=UPI000E445638|nr:hypothetical protein [Phocaeicola vulgatus]MDB1035208.1 hypothetical protein [Phocaeicola vulgatus]MDB1048152.1 hypothetical protein [Phocaeicola vulgatus]MDB1051702.1 hypothetical protein [Phocaeicola vulgatus]RGJ32265.1 hypothetical protein DXD64_21720 [Phocaeicola vulgatus]